MNYLVLLVFCSLVTGECGLTATHPDGAQFFNTIEGCRAEATKRDLDKGWQQSTLVPFSNIPPPWQTKVVCGTEDEMGLINTYIQVLNAGRANPEKAPLPERPGDRDPAPDGG